MIRRINNMEFVKLTTEEAKVIYNCLNNSSYLFKKNDWNWEPLQFYADIIKERLRSAGIDVNRDEEEEI
jgi:hypothetical protein